MFLRRKGWFVNRKRVCRLYRLERFQLRMRVRRCKYMALHCGPVPIPVGPAERRSVVSELDERHCQKVLL